MRDFVNEGGRVLYTGQRAGQQYTPGARHAALRPVREQAVPRRPGRAGALPGAVRVRRLAGRPDRVHVRRGDHDGRTAGSIPDTGDPFDVAGIDDPLDGLTWGFNGADSAQNQATNSSFIATGDFLKVTDPADSFPQFESWPAAEYQSGARRSVRPAHRAVVHVVAIAPTRRTSACRGRSRCPAGGATLSFWTSYNLELDFDYMIVEAHTVGQDDWTTLPDSNGHTSSDLSNDQSCTGRLEQPGRRGQRAASVPDALPDVRSGDGHVQQRPGTTRHVERRERQLGRLAAVRRSTCRRYAGTAGRGLDHVAERLGPPAVPGRVHRRHRGLDRRGQHLVRGRRRPDGRLDRPRRAAGRRRASRAPNRNDWVPPRRPRDQGGRGRRDRPTRSTWASASRASAAPRPATRSWVARSTTCCADTAAARAPDHLEREVRRLGLPRGGLSPMSAVGRVHPNEEGSGVAARTPAPLVTLASVPMRASRRPRATRPPGRHASVFAFAGALSRCACKQQSPPVSPGREGCWFHATEHSGVAGPRRRRHGEDRSGCSRLTYALCRRQSQPGVRRARASRTRSSRAHQTDTASMQMRGCRAGWVAPAGTRN